MSRRDKVFCFFFYGAVVIFLYINLALSVLERVGGTL